MTNRQNGQKKRGAARRTVGEGVPPRSAAVPDIGAEETRRDRVRHPSKKRARKTKKDARSVSKNSK